MVTQHVGGPRDWTLTLKGLRTPRNRKECTGWRGLLGVCTLRRSRALGESFLISLCQLLQRYLTVSPKFESHLACTPLEVSWVCRRRHLIRTHRRGQTQPHGPRETLLKLSQVNECSVSAHDLCRHGCCLCLYDHLCHFNSVCCVRLSRQKPSLFETYVGSMYLREYVIMVSVSYQESSCTLCEPRWPSSEVGCLPEGSILRLPGS